MTRPRRGADDKVRGIRPETRPQRDFALPGGKSMSVRIFNDGGKVLPRQALTPVKLFDAHPEGVHAVDLNIEINAIKRLRPPVPKLARRLQHLSTGGKRPLSSVPATTMQWFMSAAASNLPVHVQLSDVDHPALAGVGGSNAVPILDDTPEGALKLARYERELAALSLSRALMAAADQGLTQRDIARAAGMSQAEVSRTLQKLRFDPSVLDETPREHMLRRAVGSVTSYELLDTLLTFPYTTGSFHDDAYIEGSWDEVRRAQHEGLLSEREWRALSAQVKAEGPAGEPRT